ncbi:MAG: LLM class flavin-dependent oxidoreductase, partial [Dehalococcoidia bacterium]
MEFGIFHEFARRAGQSEEDAFDEGFALVAAAEAWGLDAVWLAELHFSPDRSVLAAPLTIASAIAARTQRMKIGTAVQVLPLADPLRLAEETATVDQISRGRLIFGVGRSGFARVYDAYGVSYAESRERFAEALAVIRAAWTEPAFSYQGMFYRYDHVTLTPKPFQRPHPEIRVAANSPETFPAAGEQGYPLFVAVRLGTLSELAPRIEEYRAAYRAAGHPGEGQVFLRVPVYIAEAEARATAEPEASIMQ